MPQGLSELQVSVATDTAGFDALAEDWMELETASPESGIFMSWDCQRLWWKHYQNGSQLRIVEVRDKVRLVGLLPLYIEAQRLGPRGCFKARKLRQIGLGGDTAPDDLGALLRPGFEHAAAKAMVDFLIHGLPDWDVLDLADLPASSALLAALREQLPTPGLRISCHISPPIVYGPLPKTFDEYRRGLSRNRRETMGRKLRRFEQQAGAAMQVIDSPQALDAAFDDLVRLHLLRWRDRTTHPAFSSAEFRNFHREWMHAMLAQGQLRLLVLQVQEQPIAMLYCMMYQKRMSFFQSGFDPAWAQLSPGDVLMTRAVELAIAEGCEVFDMLKGDHDYKRHFFRLERRNVQLRAFRPGWVDRAYRLTDLLRRLHHLLH